MSKIYFSKTFLVLSFKMFAHDAMHTSKVSTKEAVLDKIDDKLSFSSSRTALDDYSFVGWQMRGEMLVDLSEDPLTSNKAAASTRCCCLT